MLAFTGDRNVEMRDAQEVNFIDVSENLVWPVDQEQKEIMYQILTPKRN